MQAFLYITIVVLVLADFGAGSEYTVEHKFSGETDFTTRGSIKCSPSTKLQCFIDNNEDLVDTLSTLPGEGFYYLRVCDKGRCVQSFIKQCLLVESKLQEIIELSVSASHRIVGVSILTPLAYCNGTQAMVNRKMHTTLTVVEPATPPEPETSLYIKRVEAEKRKKKEGDGEDNRSFLAKYWMYILPVMLLVMLSSQGEQGGE
ncbi:ER membrane protein complex subunit 10-like [Watersipora subatra]|uniref:ER membrane protein complex subunit 10-like n=1 Tax=Watersipora subatra TaxID=2589382 RepID=UPI00355C1B3D